MTEVGIRALKQNASSVVAKVAAGEYMLVTDRGRPVAQLIPILPSRLESLIQTGRARPAKRAIADLTVPQQDGIDLSTALRLQREAERY